MVVTELKSSRKFVLLKVAQKSFEWKIENFLATQSICNTFVLAENLKIFLEIRSNTLVNDVACVQPFYQAEGVEKAVISISAKNHVQKSQASFVGEAGKDLGTDGEMKFISADEINEFVVDGNLTIKVEIEYYTATEDLTLGSDMSDSKEKYYNDMRSIFDKQQVSDLTYRVGDQDFPVHKVILAARSPVFLKMFGNEYKESKEGVSNEVSKESFAEFLNFIYTGEVTDLDTHAKELLVVADKYEVQDLKTVCELHLLTVLSDVEAAEVFQAAHKYHCSADLKKASFDFIKTSFAELNLFLDDNFVNAPFAVSKALLMKTNLENALKVGIAQAEKIKISSKNESEACDIVESVPALYDITE